MGQSEIQGVAAPMATALARCDVCGCALQADEGDDLKARICNSCKGRPEAKRLGKKAGADALRAAGKKAGVRDFTPAEQSLIRRMHSVMPLGSLLDILNERLAADLGPDAAPYTVEQLQTFIGAASVQGSFGTQDWAATRKFIAQARRSGTLDLVDEAVLAAFAVVFQLTTKQVLHLKDVVLGSGDE